MVSYKTTILGLITLLSSQVLAWDNCIAVPYDTFQRTKNDQHLPIIGPKGMYFNYEDGTCIYVDASANSDFAKNHAVEHAAFIAVVKENGSNTPGLDFLGGGQVRRQVGCGSVCGNNTQQKDCAVGCNCRLSSRYCNQFQCFDTYVCKRP
ncbi:hypothetical protein IQ06DRAFT_307649 [Phaeosphaeriaceae sp. SRC1lsM3a]|nr:hypothetical protein IQ06DRAFT_307649 [Stagonospora sp. SRC1lsM3a]